MVEEVAPATHWADEVLRLQDELSDMRNGMRRLGHDLRTPLNVILAYSQLLDQSPVKSESLLGFQERLRIASRQVFDVLDEMIAISDPGHRLASMTTRSKWAPLCLQSTLQQALDLMSMQGLDYQLDASGPIGYIRAPKSWVIEVFLNVLSNATKHGVKGKKVRVRTETMRPKVSERLFCVIVENETPHFISDLDLACAASGHRLQTNPNTGHGLGISIISDLMRKLGGVMDIRSFPEGAIRVTLGFLFEETP
jgi:signal transduction histidine kinase